MLRATFQLVPGLGPGRERRLWAESVLDWTQLSQAPPTVLAPRLRAPLLAAARAAEEALDDGDRVAVASALLGREHWRLFGAFAERAVYLDIDSDFRREERASYPAVARFPLRASSKSGIIAALTRPSTLSASR